MEITDKEKSILLDLFYRCHEQKAWTHAERFMIDHEDDIDVVNNLIKKDLIKVVSQYREYRISFGVFTLLEDPVIDETFQYMQKIFYALKEHYKKNMQEPYLIKDLSADLNIDRGYIVECVLYLKGLITVCGTTDTTEDDAFYVVTPRMLDFKGFDDVIALQHHYWRVNAPAQEEEPKKLLPQQIDKMMCQAVAKTLWDIDRTMTIKAMCEHPSILNYSGGKNYAYKTLRGWFSSIDPREPDKKIGRPTKKK